MNKKLTTVGNSLALIERPILDLLSIDKDTLLEVRTDGESLIIRPAPVKRERVYDATERMIATHRETLQKLAE